MIDELQIGETLDERFQVRGLISEGGMANLYRAWDRTTGQTVAIKVPHLRYESDPVYYRQFQREQALLSDLDHPAVVRLIDVPEEARSRPYLVMEMLEGHTLAECISPQQPMEPARAAGIVARLCAALSYVHDQGVVHRDLKPGNIMVCPDGSLRILDFGLATSLGRRRWGHVGLPASTGTPAYMAPEQLRGRRCDARADVYAVGAILYELATGQPPYPLDSPDATAHARLTGDPVAPRQLNPALSPQMEEIILRAMARDPAARYPNCHALQQDLEHPERVQVTGLDAQLRPPRPYRPYLRLALWWTALLTAPGVVLAVVYVLSQRH